MQLFDNFHIAVTLDFVIRHICNYIDDTRMTVLRHSCERLTSVRQSCDIRASVSQQSRDSRETFARVSHDVRANLNPFYVSQ